MNLITEVRSDLRNRKPAPAEIRTLVLAGKSSEAWNKIIPLCGGADSIGGYTFMRSLEVAVAVISGDTKSVFDLDGESFSIDKSGTVTKVDQRTAGASAIHAKLDDDFWASMPDDDGDDTGGISFED